MLLVTALLLAFFLIAWGVIQRLLPRLWRLGFRMGGALVRVVLGPQRLERWSGHRVIGMAFPRHPYRRVAGIAAAGFLAAAVLGAAFLSLGEEVRERSPAVQRLDHDVWELARTHRSPGRTTFFIAFTILGTPVGLATLVLGGAGLLAARGYRRLPLFLIGSSVGAWALNALLKAIFARARPDLTLAVRMASGYSFPSGHAMLSLVVCGALVYVLLRVSHRRAVQSLGAAAALSIVLAVSASRVYLGVHWTSDIAGGWAAGLVWLATSIAVYEVVRRRRLLRQAVPAA